MNRFDPQRDIADAHCAREPIHLAGAIQPHGWLLVCDLADQRIHAVSQNMATLFAVDIAEMLGRPVTDYIDADVIASCISMSDPRANRPSPQHIGQHNIGDMARLLDISAHRNGELLHLEFQPSPRQSKGPSFLSRTQLAVSDTAGITDLCVFLQEFMEELRALTGFDRVMTYRFLSDDTGIVEAESVGPAMEPWLGQRYPASDIPAQARALYLRNRIRVIPDAGYVPVAVLQAAGTAPLDMSYNVLRAISPVHQQYLRNMGVGAAMSVSLVVGAKLWGLLLFQHREPRDVSAQAREALELMGAFCATRVAAQDQVRTYLNDRRVRSICEVLKERGAHDFATLAAELPMVTHLLRNDGVALLHGGEWKTRDITIGESDRAALATWLHAQAAAGVVATDEAAWRDGRLVDDEPAGVLAINLGAAEDWLLFLRQPYDEEIRWAGIPDKQVTQREDGSIEIAPRADFTVWRDLHKGRSEAWVEHDLDAARRLHEVLTGRSVDSTDTNGR